MLKQCLVCVGLLCWAACFSTVWGQAPSAAEADVPRWVAGVRAGAGVPVYRGTQVEEPRAYFGPVGGLGVRRRLGPAWALQADLLLNRRLAGAEYVETSYRDTTVNVYLGTFTIPIRDSSYRSDVVNSTRITFTYLDLALGARWAFARQPGYELYFLGGGILHWVASSKLSGTTTVYIREFDTFGDITLVGSETAIDPNTLTFSQWDVSAYFGGGSRFQLGRRSAFVFEMRFALGIPDVETTPKVEMRTGHFGVLMGYEFGW